MAETSIRKAEPTAAPSAFTLNGLLIGYLVFGLVIVSMAIFVASLPPIQARMRDMLSFDRGQLLFISFLLGLALTTPFAFYFEKKSRE